MVDVKQGVSKDHVLGKNKEHVDGGITHTFCTWDLGYVVC